MKEKEAIELQVIALIDGEMIYAHFGHMGTAALALKTGEVKWKFSFGTLLVVEVEGEKVVVSQGSGVIGGYRPVDGKLLWWVDNLKGFSIIPRPVAKDGIVYVATVFASPIAFDGALIVRSKSKLWRFGKK